MPIEDTKRLVNTDSLPEANAHLDAGWTLLSIDEIKIGDSSITKYTLGWQKDGAPVKVPFKSGW